MTLNCIDPAQSPTHKGNLLQGRKSSLSHQQNARRSSCSPPLPKANSQQSESCKQQLNSTAAPPAAKLERSVSCSETASERKMVQNTNSSRYKTELCRPFEENGTCKYGDKCQFAHGQKEMRSMTRHPKYKTELCRTFHSTGLCPYGPRCHFIHNSEQTKKNLLTNLSTSSAPIITVGIRPKALTSLGSDGELSPPPSCNEVTPDDLKCFNEVFTSSPPLPPSPSHLSDVFITEMSPGVFAFPDIFERSEDPGKGQILSPGSPEYYVYGDEIDIDNHKCQGGSVFNFDLENNKCGPVLSLFSTAPSSPPHNYNFFKLNVYDAFRNNFQQKIH